MFQINSCSEGSILLTCWLEVLGVGRSDSEFHSNGNCACFNKVSAFQTYLEIHSILK